MEETIGLTGHGAGSKEQKRCKYWFFPPCSPSFYYAFTMATGRTHPALADLIFTGKQTNVNP
jgi:hypothetical protein